ncbi:hypothetical protein QTN25_006231 [Entamoeba marina]
MNISTEEQPYFLHAKRMLENVKNNIQNRECYLKKLNNNLDSIDAIQSSIDIDLNELQQKREESQQPIVEETE